MLDFIFLTSLFVGFFSIIMFANWCGKQTNK
ncbi:hypothetical protein BJV38_003584 [Clostridium beijerinckii]|nr:hypothetical protein [Clostridium beijerinckii]